VTKSEIQPLIRDRWIILAHPAFLDTLEKLVAAVARAKEKNPSTYREKKSTKLLLAIRKLINQRIIPDPLHKDFRHGGKDGLSQDWFRGKYDRYRLFFRVREDSRTIILGWLNDEDSGLREEGGKNDPYKVFRQMVGNNRPPTDWDALLAGASSPGSVERAKEIIF
jgi:hypothetical protein